MKAFYVRNKSKSGKPSSIWRKVMAHSEKDAVLRDAIRQDRIKGGKNNFQVRVKKKSKKPFWLG